MESRYNEMVGIEFQPARLYALYQVQLSSKAIKAGNGKSYRWTVHLPLLIG